MNTTPSVPDGPGMEEDEKYFFTLRVIHLALVGGVVLFGGVLCIIMGKEISLRPDYRNPIILAAGIFCLGSLAASFFLRPSRKRNIVPPDGRHFRPNYQAFCLLRWGVIEGGALFAAVATLVTKNVLPLVLFGACLALLAYRVPSREEYDSLRERIERG